MVFDDAGEDQRPTATPHLVIEILSSDPARDIIRKAAEYAAAGLQRYWIVDPDGPEIIVHRLVDGVLVEQGRYGPGTLVTFDPPSCSADPAASFRPASSGSRCSGSTTAATGTGTCREPARRPTRYS